MTESLKSQRNRGTRVQNDLQVIVQACIFRVFLGGGTSEVVFSNNGIAKKMEMCNTI